MATACGDEYTEETKEALHEAEKGYDSEITQEVWGEVLEQNMPEVEKEVERLEKEFDEKWQEIEREFGKITEEMPGVKFEKIDIPTQPEEVWRPDEFEKEGFGPIIRQPPEPKEIFGDIKIEKVSEIKTKGKERVLGEAGPPAKLYDPRTTEEIKRKVDQLNKGLEVMFKDRITPEEKAIIKESEVAKDTEKIQREWVEKGTKIHEQGHHLIMDPRVVTQATLFKFERLFEECKKEDKFVSNRARVDITNFFAENYRMFFTNPEKVKEVSPEVHREIDKIVIHLSTLEMIEQMKESH